MANNNQNDKGNGGNFSVVKRSEIPFGRRGKHRKMVKDILDDLAALKKGQAVSIPLETLKGEKLQNLRSALNRVTRKGANPVATSSDEDHLYVWHADSPKNSGPA